MSEGEQVAEVGDEASVEHLLDAALGQTFDVELVAAGRVDDGRQGVAVAALDAPPPLLRLVDVAAAVRARLRDGNRLLVAGAQVNDGRLDPRDDAGLVDGDRVTSRSLVDVHWQGWWIISEGVSLCDLARSSRRPSSSAGPLCTDT
ncbi:hypothetical protein [Nonomuraea jabiensis]|uniref:hypothetical protein n=1 Tax=Nonomuraea jabiensis TaxID=882448 RepID=UPI003D7421A4